MTDIIILLLLLSAFGVTVKFLTVFAQTHRRFWKQVGVQPFHSSPNRSLAAVYAHDDYGM